MDAYAQDMNKESFNTLKGGLDELTTKLQEKRAKGLVDSDVVEAITLIQVLIDRLVKMAPERK